MGTAELARFLGLSRPYVQRQCSAGHWPHRRIGKRIQFAPADVEWIAGQSAREIRPDVEPVPRVNRPRKRYPDSVR